MLLSEVTMDDEALFFLGQITRHAFPEGAPPELINLLLTSPCQGFKRLNLHTDIRGMRPLLAQWQQRLQHTVDASCAIDPYRQGPFWMGYYSSLEQLDQAELGPTALNEAGEALYGARWQSDLARDIQIGDPRRVRQWLSGDRGIRPGVWADISSLLRNRAFKALQIAQKLDNAQERRDG